MDVRDKEVLVLGAGVSGAAAARLLAGRGARVRVSESGDTPEIRHRAAELEAAGCRVELGGHRGAFARGVSLAVVSPGIDPAIPAVRSLENAGVPVIAEIELAYAFCSRPIVAVTGTNGKTTTVTLIELALRRAGRDAVACGNIGRPFSEVVGGAREPELYVVEASSFQLERIREFRPFVALALNVADDHLDRYRGFREYRGAKAMLFRNQRAGDWAVVRAEELIAWKGAGLGQGQSVLCFSGSSILAEGAYAEGDSLVVRRGGGKERICRRGDLRISGGHNVENVLAAAAAASIFGVAARTTGEAAREFRGLPHRMEAAGSRGGVSFINDSKATNPDAVARALRSVQGPVILIAGGRDKGFDYSVLAPALAGRVKTVILIGEAAEKMRRDIGAAAGCRLAGSLEAAVREAHALAAPGDTVLLSPACSSYDMFRNFEERGEAFKRLVREITATAGRARRAARVRGGAGR